MFDVLNILAAAVTAGLGVYGLLLPHKAAQLVRLEATGLEGRSEFRASFGGLWIGLGVVPLATMEPMVFAMAGIVWLTTALGRLISFAFDETLSRQNIINIGFEVACGGLLLLGAPFTTLASL